MSCRRTRRIVEAALEGRAPGPSDQGHVATCRHCTAALKRLPEFEAELRAAARSLVDDAAASDVPAPPTPVARPGPPGQRRLLAGLAAVVAVVAVAIGALALVVGPRGDESTVAGPLPIDEPDAVAALTNLAFQCQADVVVDQFASPPVEGSACARVGSGLQQGAGLEQMNVDLRRGDEGVGRVLVVLRQTQIEINQGPGSFTPPTSVPLDPDTSTERLSEVVRAVFAPAQAAELEATLRSMIDAEGRACDCERPTSAGTIRLDGDAIAGYGLTIGSGAGPLPPVSPPPTPEPLPSLRPLLPSPATED